MTLRLNAPVIASVLLVLMACNKQAEPMQDQPLQGDWVMTDSYIGRGDGTVDHQQIDRVYFTYTVTDSLYRLYDDVVTSTSLTGITDSTYIAEESSIPYRYDITGDRMELRHACDEGCRWLFKKTFDRNFPW